MLFRVEVDAFNRGIADPIYELVDIETSKHVAVYGFILANEFGVDVSDYRKNKLFYYILAVAEQSCIANMMYDDFLDRSPKRRTQEAAWVKHGPATAVNATVLLNMQILANLKYY